MRVNLENEAEVVHETEVDLQVDGKTTVRHHHPGYKHTEVGWIPQEWEVKTLTDVSEKIMVGIASAATHAYRKTGIIMFRNQNIKAGYLDDNDILFIEEEYEKQHRNKRLHEGDILIARTGYPGTACLVPAQYKGAQSFTTLIVRPRQSIILSEFLCFYINSDKGQGYFETSQIGGGQKNVNAGTLELMPTVVPTLPEQLAIATLLLTWDKAIDQTTRLLTQKELRKKWLMQQLLTGKKRLSGFKGEWKEVWLGEVFSERNEAGRGDLPLLSITADRGVIYQYNSDKKDTSNEDKSKYRRICPGDIGYNTMRMWQGRSALSTIDGIVSPAYTIVTPKPEADSQFFAYLFKFEPMVHRFFRNSQGLVDDTLNCKFRDFAAIHILLPSKEEQVAIANVLKVADKEIQLIAKRIEQLKEQKKGLMQVLLTGKIRLVK